MPMSSSRIAITFSCIGHFYVHVLIAIYLTLVLALERSWGESYDSLIALWTPGALMIGLGAPLAGWLADRWGEVRLMILFFIGTGIATVLAGLAQGPAQLAACLTLLGLFASIYHPVGTSWAIRNAVSRGRVVGLVGAAGGLGAPVAAVLAGTVAETTSWRVAFVLPGAIAIATGVVLLWAAASARVVDRGTDLSPERAASRANMVRAFLVLSLTMMLSSVVYWAFTTALPKWLSQGLGAQVGNSMIGIGALVATVLLVGNIAQIVSGFLLDRWPAKWVYVLSFVFKFPALAVAAAIGGWPMMIAAVVVVFMFDVASPAESILIAKYSPNRHRGLVYGIRNGAALVAAPMGVQLVAWFYAWFDGFASLFLILSGIIAIVFAIAVLLPREESVVGTDFGRSTGRAPAA